MSLNKLAKLATNVYFFWYALKRLRNEFDTKILKKNTGYMLVNLKGVLGCKQTVRRDKPVNLLVEAIQGNLRTSISTLFQRSGISVENLKHQC